MQGARSVAGENDFLRDESMMPLTISLNAAR
jgi:hypothetical protein